MQTTFPLSSSGTAITPGTSQNILVSISGVLQEPVTAYTVSGNSIIFSEAPLATDTFFGTLMGNIGDLSLLANVDNFKTVNGVSVLGSGNISTQSAVVAVAGTQQNALSGFHYVLTNVSSTTLTLPSLPSEGDTVAITPANGLATNVIARNGQTIMGLSEDMTIDITTVTVTLRFLNSTWRII